SFSSFCCPLFHLLFIFHQLLCLSIPKIRHHGHKLCILRTAQLINRKSVQCIAVSPEYLRVDQKIKLKFCHQPEHVSDIPVIHTRKGLIQANQPRSVCPPAFILRNHSRKQRYIHCHRLFSPAECSKHTVRQLFDLFAAFLEKQLEF